MNRPLFISTLLAFSLLSCVNGKMDPAVAPVLKAIDTAGCELITVFVKDQEAGDVCVSTSKFFNTLLSDFSAPPKMAEVMPKKYPVKYQGVTIGHFYKPFNASIQAKIDAMPADKDLTQP